MPSSFTTFIIKLKKDVLFEHAVTYFKLSGYVRKTYNLSKLIHFNDVLWNFNSL